MNVGYRVPAAPTAMPPLRARIGLYQFELYGFVTPLFRGGLARLGVLARAQDWVQLSPSGSALRKGLEFSADGQAGLA